MNEMNEIYDREEIPVFEEDINFFSNYEDFMQRHSDDLVEQSYNACKFIVDNNIEKSAVAQIDITHDLDNSASAIEELPIPTTFIDDGSFENGYLTIRLYVFREDVMECLNKIFKESIDMEYYELSQKIKDLQNYIEENDLVKRFTI